MTNPTVQELLDASANASKARKELEQLLRKCTPQTVISNQVYDALRAAEVTEGRLRDAVRSHPDFTYEGL